MGAGCFNDECECKSISFAFRLRLKYPWKQPPESFPFFFLAWIFFPRRIRVIHSPFRPVVHSRRKLSTLRGIPYYIFCGQLETHLT